MKIKNIIYTLSFVLAISFFYGCREEDDNVRIKLDTVEDGMHLSASAEEVVLSQELMDDIALTFQWSPAQVRKNNGTLSYYLKIGLPGFATAIDKIQIEDGVYQYSVAHWELNEITSKLGIAYGGTAELEAEIIAWSDGDYFVEPEISTTKFIVTSFALSPVNLYLVGTANPNGSELSNGIRLAEVVLGKNFGNQYKWEGNLKAGTFKFVNSLIEDGGSWSMGASSTELVKNETNSSSDIEFTVTKAGLYSIILNKENKEIIYGYKGFNNVWGVGLGIGIAWAMPSSTIFNWDARNPSIFTLECTTQANQDFKLPYNSQSNGWSSPFLRPMAANGNIWADNRVQATTSGADLKWLITADQAGKCLLTIDADKMTISLEKLN